MKKILFFILVIMTCNSSLAYNYSDADKEMFYNSFINGYIDGMTDYITASALPQDKKDKFLTEFKKLINREELINSSWTCIEKYSIKEIVSAAITCTEDWTDRQAARNKKLLESLD